MKDLAGKMARISAPMLFEGEKVIRGIEYSVDGTGITWEGADLPKGGFHPVGLISVHDVQTDPKTAPEPKRVIKLADVPESVKREIAEGVSASTAAAVAEERRKVAELQAQLDAIKAQTAAIAPPPQPAPAKEVAKAATAKEPAK